MTKPDTVLLTICRLTIALLVMGSPWYLGAVLPSTQVILQYGMLAAGVLVVVRLLATQSPTLATDFARIPAVLLPLLGLLFLGIAQCLLPAAGPHGASGALDSAVSLPLIHPVRISIYPHATQLASIRLAAVIALFGIVVCCFSTVRSQRLMITLIAFNGVALAFFGFVQKLTWNGKLFWTIELTQGGTPFSTYVNRNNAAGYLNLALACAVGILFGSWQEMRSDARGLVPRVAQFIGQLNERFLFAIVSCLVIFTGILFSLSRSGLIAAVMAMVATLLCMKGKSRWSLWVSAVVVALCVWQSYTFLNWLDPDRALEERFEEVVTQVAADEITMNGRIRHWTTAVAAGMDHLTAGTGLGTHRYAHLAYHREVFAYWAVNADNQFVELFVESGVTGIALILIEFALLWFAIRRVQRYEPRDPISVIAVFALTSQIVMGCFDFGIILPANAIAAATIFGMLAARDLSLRRRRGESPGIPGMAGLLIVLTVAGSFALGNLQFFAAASQTQRAIDRFLDAEEPWTHTVTEADGLIRQATTALQSDPNNAELHESLGKLWVNRYRQQAYARLDGSESNDGYTARDIWDTTSPTYIHVIATRERLASRTESLARIRSLSEISDNLEQAMRHFRRAAVICPAMPGVDVQIARLGIVTDVDSDSTGSLLAAVSKSPTNMSVLYSAGLIAFHEEQHDVCFAIWKQYLKRFPTVVRNRRVHIRNFESIFSVLATRYPFDVVIDRVMPDYGPFYPQFLASSSANKNPASYFPRIYEKMLASLDAHPHEESGQWNFLRATALSALQREDEAIAAYRQSFRDDVNSIERRVQLVEYLQSLERFDEAFDEGSVCLHLAPERQDIEQLVREIARQRHR